MGSTALFVRAGYSAKKKGAPSREVASVRRARGEDKPGPESAAPFRVSLLSQSSFLSFHHVARIGLRPNEVNKLLRQRLPFGIIPCYSKKLDQTPPIMTGRPGLAY